MKKMIHCVVLALSFLSSGYAIADEAIPQSECRIESDGDSAQCNVKNLFSRTIVCSIEIIGTTRKGEVLKNVQKRTIPSEKYVIQHVKHFGDYEKDPIVKVEGFTRCQ